MSVERHLDAGRDATGDERSASRGPTFPVRATGLVEMDETIDGAGKDNAADRINLRAGTLTQLGLERHDSTICHADVHAGTTRLLDDLTIADDQVEHRHRAANPLLPVCNPATPFYVLEDRRSQPAAVEDGGGGLSGEGKDGYNPRQEFADFRTTQYKDPTT